MCVWGGGGCCGAGGGGVHPLKGCVCKVLPCLEGGGYKRFLTCDFPIL